MNLSVCFCVNRLMFAPMCIALNSALRRFTGPAPGVHVLHTDLTHHHIRFLGTLFPGVDLSFHEIDVTPFATFPGLHGDFTAYGKLCIPYVIEDLTTPILYLDADVIVRTDLSQLAVDTFTSSLVAVRTSGGAVWSFNWPLYQAVGFSPDERVFNSGVMLLYPDRCRKQSLWDKAFETATQHGRTWDEPLFNILFRDEGESLPTKYNVHAGPLKELPCQDIDGIVHFVGSPKPWDRFGSVLHSNYHYFAEELAALAVPWRKLPHGTSWRELRRTALLGRSYWRAFKTRVSSNRTKVTC